MIDTDDLVLIAQYLQAHNEGRQLQKWWALAYLFDPEGVLRFEGIHLGPFQGCEAIRQAYEDNPRRTTWSSTQMGLSEPGKLLSLATPGFETPMTLRASFDFGSTKTS